MRLELLRPTPEGRILFALAEGPMTYSELREFTGLSNRWLSMKLRELVEAGVVGRRGRKYVLARPEVLEEDPAALGYLRRMSSPRAIAFLVARGLSRDERVLAVILFGSAARGSWREESDLDLLVVTSEGELYDEVYELSFRYLVPVEAVFLTLDEFLLHAGLMSSLVMGVLEGYEVLFDRVGLSGVLEALRRRALEEFEYDREAGAWIRRRGPTTRPR